MERPISGGLLLALAVVDLDRGARAGDQRATRLGARMIALAERFRFPRNFQPTMSAGRAGQGRAGRPVGVPRRGVVVRRPGRGGAAGRRPGRAAGAARG